MSEPDRTPIKIHPSILAADFANLETELNRIRGADGAHVDVMDNHFVPNLTLGAPVVARIHEVSPAPIDVHLMIDNVDRWALEYAHGAPGATITFHAEASAAPVRTARLIREAGAKVGLAVRPATPVEPFLSMLDEIDLLLLMSVEPGFGGQPFLELVLPKIRHARAALDQHAQQRGGQPVQLQIDGGVTEKTIGRAAQAGAHVFVAGSAVFGAGDPAENIATLRQLAHQGCS